jgi:hypothetical protein
MGIGIGVSPAGVPASPGCGEPGMGMGMGRPPAEEGPV